MSGMEELMSIPERIGVVRETSEGEEKPREGSVVMDQLGSDEEGVDLGELLVGSGEVEKRDGVMRLRVAPLLRFCRT